MGSNKRNVLALLVTGLLIAAGSFYVGRLSDGVRRSDDRPAGQAATASKEMSQEREVLYWRAPMDPNEIYEQPGKSRMGMDLVPVYAEDMGGGTVSIDPVTLQNIGVRTTPVVVEPLRTSVRTTGRFEMDESGARSVTLKVGGWVEKLYVNFEGSIVRAGDPLLELYSPDLVATQEEFILAVRNARRYEDQSAVADAQRLLDAARRRLAYWDLDEAQLRQIEETLEPLRTITFYAPASGEVMNKMVDEGQQVKPGEHLMDIMDISRIWLIVDIYEQDLSWVSVGTQAEIELPYQPGQTFNGRVDHLYFMLDENTRSAKARIVLPSPQRKFKPGMFATVTLLGEDRSPTMVVPVEAIIRSGEDQLVIVALGDGRFRPAKVTTGVEFEGKVQILDGLREGDEIVTSAQFLIDSEARVQTAVASLVFGEPEVQNAPHDHQMDAPQKMDMGHDSTKMMHNH